MNTNININELDGWEPVDNANVPANIMRNVEARKNGEQMWWDYEPTIVEKIKMFAADAVNEIRWFFINLKNRY